MINSGQPLEIDPFMCPKTGEICGFVDFCKSKKTALDKDISKTHNTIPEAVTKAFAGDFCAKKIGKNLVEAAFNPSTPCYDASVAVKMASMVNRGQDPFPAAE